MRTTAVVLSVDEAHLLRHCLPAVEGADLVVIDNACTDDTVAVAAEYGARVVALPERVSYAAAVNAGLATVTADAVLLLNADCFLEPGFLEAALPHLEDPGVGSVAPKLLRVSGPDAEPDAIDAAGMWIDRRRKNGLVGHGEPVTARAERGEVFGADGACALYRREALGAFDEDMALWATDADVAWRARRAGWRCVYEPAATARHIRTYSPSTRARTSEEHRRIQFRNRYLMMVRNESPGSLVRNLPWILGYEILALGHVVLRERFLARGYVEAARLAPRVWRRRELTVDRREWDALARRDAKAAVCSDLARDDDAFFATGEAEIEGLVAALEERGWLAARGRALDFGCGLGRLTAALARRFGTATGVDISAEMVARARAAHDLPNLTFAVNPTPDLSTHPNDAYDLVVSFITLQHVTSRAAVRNYIREFVRVAKPGGTIVFQVPTKVSARVRLHVITRRGMRLAGLPEAEVRALLTEAGAEVVTAYPDRRTGSDDAPSLTYVALARDLHAIRT